LVHVATLSPECAARRLLLVGLTDSARTTSGLPTSARSTGRPDEGKGDRERLKGAAGGHAAGRGRRKKRKESARTAADVDDDDGDEDGYGGAGWRAAVGRRVREARFNTRTSQQLVLHQMLLHNVAIVLPIYLRYGRIRVSFGTKILPRVSSRSCARASTHVHLAVRSAASRPVDAEYRRLLVRTTLRDRDRSLLSWRMKRLVDRERERCVLAEDSRLRVRVSPSTRAKSATHGAKAAEGVRWSVTRFASFGGTTAELPSNTRNRSENVARGRQHAKSHAANFLLERLGKIVNHRFNVLSFLCAAFDLIPAYLSGPAISLVNKRGLETLGARLSALFPP